VAGGTLTHGTTGRGAVGAGKDLWTEAENLLNKHDSAGVASLYASDAVLTDPSGRYEGREAIRAFLEAMVKSFDENLETSLLVEEGDTTVAEYTWRGTNTGPLTMPDGTEIPATGKTVEMLGVAIITVRDGKIVSERDYVDMAAMMSQLGLMP
jgi:steroid delta-isomerase-like uncharacterized protein